MPRSGALRSCEATYANWSSSRLLLLERVREARQLLGLALDLLARDAPAR